MFGINPIRIVISGVDQFSSVLRHAVRDVRRLGTDIDQAARGITKVGVAVAGLGLGLAHATGLTEIPRIALESQHALRSLGNVGELTTEQLSGISHQITKISKETNQVEMSLLEATKTLVASGMDVSNALKFLPSIGQAATAEGADVNDLAKVLFTANDNMKVGIEDLGKALDVMTLAGKRGRFELKDMAREFPALTASAKFLGITGVAGISKLSAALQMAVKGAANPQEAATNFSNFLQKITSQEVMKNFLAIPTGPINLVKELDKILKGNKDPIEEMTRLVNSVLEAPSGGKLPGEADKIARMTFLFRDKQLLDFIKAMVPNLEKYRALRDEVMTADGEVAKDYRAMLGTLLEQWKKFRISLAATIMPKLEKPLQVITGWLKEINENQGAMDKIVKGIIALVVVGTSLTVLGAVLGFIAAGVAVVTSQVFLWGAALVGVGGLVWAFFANWDKGWVKALAVVIGFAFPIAGVVMFIIMYWKRLLPFFKFLWLAISGLFKVGVIALKAFLDPVIWLLDKIMKAIDFVINGVFNLVGALAGVMLPEWLKERIGLNVDTVKSGGSNSLAQPQFRDPLASSFGSANKKDKLDVVMDFKNMPRWMVADTKSTPGMNLDVLKTGLLFGTP